MNKYVVLPEQMAHRIDLIVTTKAKVTGTLKRTGTFKQQITPPPPQNGYVVNAHTEMEEVVCNATNIGKSVPAVPIVPVRLRSGEGEVLTYAMLDACSRRYFVSSLV